jgi:hypothetical protein
MKRSAGRVVAAVVAVCAIVVLVTGCGGGDVKVSAAARAGLAPLVEQVRHAAESRDPRAARLALTAVRQAVAADAKQGDISAAGAAEILAAVAGVEDRLSLAVPTTTTTVAAPTTTTTDQKPAGKPHGRGDKGKGEGD